MLAARVEQKNGPKTRTGQVTAEQIFSALSFFIEMGLDLSTFVTHHADRELAVRIFMLLDLPKLCPIESADGTAESKKVCVHRSSKISSRASDRSTVPGWRWRD